MEAESDSNKSSFNWNAGAWIGTQLGSTVWMLAGGISLLFSDPISAFVCLGGFVVFNAFGFYLWRSREKLSTYVALQRLMLAMTATFTLILVVLHRRGTVSTWEMLLGIALPPTLMLMFFVREWAAKRKARSPVQNKSTESTIADGT